MIRIINATSAVLVLVTMFAASIAAAQQGNWSAVAIGGFAKPRFGIFDPSVAKAPDGRLYMSFSAVQPSRNWPRRNSRVVSTHLARSSDGGKSWRAVGEVVNSAREVTGTGDAISWQHEVSTLVYDPAARNSERWRLIWHQYPQINGKRGFQFGWIAMKTAATPQALARAEKVKLFTGRVQQEKPALASPVPGSPVLALNRLHPDLKNCAIFTEPGAMIRDGALYLALLCAERRGLGVKPKIILLKCAAPCRAGRASAWSYLGTALGFDDARRIGFKSFSAPALFEANGSTYLIATPTSSKPFKDAYNGCLIYRFADIETARLARRDDQPAMVRSISGDPRSFNGACEVSATPPRIWLSQLVMNGKMPLFTIRRKDLPGFPR